MHSWPTVVVLALVLQVHCSVFYPVKEYSNRTAFRRHWVVAVEAEHLGCVSYLSANRGAEFPIGSARDEDVQERQLSDIIFFLCELDVGEDAVTQVLEVC
ncbi:unnamed protein product [Dibothriocephalus latus]|uniref:Secreted protein n=1 Tax=Dibothriocephalus latus TaxID=60516 RepID=A0A3P7LFL9_DIBLA|nr:unnamed protein product [Dibothriocephalus latus]